MKKILLTNILCFLTFISTYAQPTSNTPLEISGTVLDATTHQPLPNASIGLFEKMTKKLVQAELSDIEGKFTFSHLTAQAYTLRIQYIGYEEKMIDTLAFDQAIDLKIIYLISIKTNLSEVNIKATKPIIEQKTNNLVVNVAESALATGGTVYEILQKTPGVTSSEGELSLRGKKLSLLLDGRLVNLPAEEVINILQNMPASSIEKLELISNPSSKYDGQVQAILNIKTLKPKDDSWGGNIILAAGAGRKFRDNSSINLFYKKNKLAVTLGWDYINVPKYNFINRVIGPPQNSLNYVFNSQDNELTQSYTHTLKLDMDYAFHPNHSIGLLIRPMINPQHVIYNGENNIQEGDSNIIDSVYQSTIQSDIDYKSINGNIYYKTTFDAKRNKELAINADYYGYSRSSIANYNIKTLEGDGSEKRPATIQRNDNPMDINIWSATVDYTHTTKKNKWETGLKTSWIGIDNGLGWDTYNGTQWITDKALANDFLYNETINAAYINVSKESKKINYQLSLRAEHTSIHGVSSSLQTPLIKNYLNLLPHINIEYNPSKKHQWIISYQQTIKRPSYTDVNPFLRMLTPSVYRQGNTSIMPQLEYIGDFIYSYHQQFFVQATYLQMTPFIGSIFRLNSTQTSVRKVENYTTADTWSIGISINKSLYNWWQTNTYVGVKYFEAKHPEIIPGKSSPWLNFSISSIISLPAYLSFELSISGRSSFYDGFYYHLPTYSISGGIKKSFLQKRLTTSLLVNLNLPHWLGSWSLYNRYETFNNFDQSFAMLSFSYKLGNTKNAIKNRQSQIDAEKNRTKE